MEIIQNTLQNIIPFLIVLTSLIFIHEFGHFWVARKFGVKIEIFSIGFGKELFGFNDSHGTRWKFSMIPLGGYVKMFGDKDPSSQMDDDLIAKLSEEEKKHSFHNKSLISKSLIVAAGPLANYLLAIIIFSSFFFHYGFPHSSSVVNKVIENGAANKAGIETGDKIIAIDDQKIDSFNDIVNHMALNMGNEVTLTYEHQGKLIKQKLKPQKFIDKDILGNEVDSYKLGIIADKTQLVPQSFISALKLAVIECYNLTKSSLKGMAQILTGKRSSKELAGPIKIAQYSAKSAASGIQNLLWFIALLSVNLGLMNLLPIPVLDGGHLLIFATQAVFGKKISGKIQKYGYQIGLVLLISLTILTTYNDLTDVFISFFSK